MSDHRDRRVRRTIESIHSALFSMLEEGPYDGITVTALAERADINRKTFYMYYTGIDDLVRHIEAELFEKYRPMIRNFDMASTDFDAYEYFGHLSGMLEKDIHVLRLLESTGKLLVFEEQIKTLLVEALTVQLSESRNPRELHLYLEYATAGIMSMLSDWIRDPQYTVEELVTFLGRVLMSGFQAVH